MDNEPWESLDINDSDLPMFLKSCTFKPSSSNERSLIPGPAGAVQAIMQNRQSDQALATQEFLSRIKEVNDKQFSQTLWIEAKQFVESNGLLEANDLVELVTVSSINDRFKKVPLMIGLVKNIKHNGFGDASITLIDRTGSIDGTIHQSVFIVDDIGQKITVGSVLLLCSVSVFHAVPRRAKCYLNITMQNIVQVFAFEN